MVASETALTSILEVLLAELLGDVVVVLAESDTVAVVVVAPAGGWRPPREPRRRDRGGGGQEGAPGGGGGGAAQRERHGERSVRWRGVGRGTRLGFHSRLPLLRRNAGDWSWRCRMDTTPAQYGMLKSGPINLAHKAGGRPS